MPYLSSYIILRDFIITYKRCIVKINKFIANDCSIVVEGIKIIPRDNSNIKDPTSLFIKCTKAASVLA